MNNNRTFLTLAAGLILIIVAISCTTPTQTPTVTPFPPTSTIILTPTNTPETPTEEPEVPTPTPIPWGPEIHEIQGENHKSPYEGEVVSNVMGIVTFTRTNGFYMQSLNPDDNDATSEGILIFKYGIPKVKAGDIVLVSGTVEEFYPGGASTGNLSITQIDLDEFTVISSDNPLPEPIIIGVGGRMPPVKIIDDDKFSVFDPESDGIDFYESMESMLIQVVDAIVVGPTNQYNETVLLASGGTGAEIISSKNTIVIREDDYNPERIILDDAIRAIPTDLNVGDRITTPVVGIMDYTFGNFKLQPIEIFTYEHTDLELDVATPPGENELLIASYNVLNLDGLDAPQRFETLANHIVNNLSSPDIIALQEIQDNNGAQTGGTTEANETYQKIIDAVLAIGGPTYAYSDIAPTSNQDGGEPGGNIRVGFLYRTDRGLTFIPRPGGDATTSVEVTMGANGVELSFNPGRIEPRDPAFSTSRKPLIGQFSFNGHTIFVITSHLNSKGGDDGLFGSQQPPILASEVQRNEQAEVLHDFVSSILELDPNANIVVLGDLNDFQFSKPLAILGGDVLINLHSTLPEEERFSYIYDGNAQVLDHILVSQAMFESLASFEEVHINSLFNYWVRFSDHDPPVARFYLP